MTALSHIARTLRVQRILWIWEKLRDGLELRFGQRDVKHDW